MNAYKNGLRYMLDSADFLKDSLFCEWAYIINLSTKRLEVYRGFQVRKPSPNRYDLQVADGENPAYWNCSLESDIPLDDIRKESDLSKFIDRMLAIPGV